MNNLIPGTVVSTMVGPIGHFGIASDRQIGGLQCIISCSQATGQVSEEPANIFTNGKKIKIHAYPGALSPSVVINRARSKLGTAYNFLSWNCEHFIRWVHGIKVESPQLQISALIGLGILGLFYLKQREHG